MTGNSFYPLNWVRFSGEHCTENVSSLLGEPTAIGLRPSEGERRMVRTVTSDTRRLVSNR